MSLSEPNNLHATLSTPQLSAVLADGTPGPPGPAGPQGPPGDPATQTPWAQNIDGAGFDLANTGDVGIGGSAIIGGDLSVLGTIAGSLMMIPPPPDGVFRVGEGWQLGPVADKLTLTADGSLIWQIASNLIGFDVPLSVNGQIEARLGGIKFPDGTVQITAADSGAVGAVESVFGRTGVVTAQAGDYTAAQITDAVSTLGSYADPSWLTSLAYSKLTGVPSSFTPSAHVHAAGDVTSGVFATARLGSGVADGSVYLRGDGQWAAVSGFAPLVHTHAAGDVTSGIFAVARLGGGTPSALTYLRGDGQWAASSVLQTPWTSHIDAAGYELRNAGAVGVGVSTPLAKLAVVGASSSSSAILHVGTGTGGANDHRLEAGFVDGSYAWLQAQQPGVAYRNLVLQPGGGNVWIGTTGGTYKVEVEGGRSLFTSGDAFGLGLRYDSGAASFIWLGAGGDGRFVVSSNSGANLFVVLQTGGVAVPSLPSSNPGGGSKQFWYDPADSNRVKFAA